MEGKQSIILIFLSIFALMGMGLGFALGNYVYLSKKPEKSKFLQL